MIRQRLTGANALNAATSLGIPRTLIPSRLFTSRPEPSTITSQSQSRLFRPGRSTDLIIVGSMSGRHEGQGTLAILLHRTSEWSKPNKVHVKRKHQSKRYHERIQKKWNKRFGVLADRLVVIPPIWNT